MSVVSPSAVVDATAAAALGNVRARSGVSIAFKASPADGVAPLVTRLADLHEWGGLRAKLPQTHGHAEAVLINTGGGLLGGDVVAIDVTVGDQAKAQVTTQSAERIYRSLGPDCRVGITLSVGAKAHLLWLPQETILFDRARLTRTITVHMASDATLLLVEATVFGRAAMAEAVITGAFHDVWRIWRGRHLVFADTIALRGPIQQAMARAAVGDGAVAAATVVYIAPDAAERRDGARSSLQGQRGRAAVSAWNDMLVGRFLAPTADALKADVAALAAHLCGHPLPRVWGLA